MPRILRGLHFDPPYDRIFEGLLVFKSFSDTEMTIRRLDELRLRFMHEKDQVGLNGTRKVALLGRQRAEALVRNARVSAGHRQRKAEMALWFRVWLETPDLFPTWLAMRKESPEFEKLLSLESAASIDEVGPQK